MIWYYISLGIMWGTLWCVTAMLLGVLPDDLRKYHLRRWHRWSVAGTVTRMTEHPRIVLSAGAIVFAVIYVLSYAPTEQALAAGRLPWSRAMMDFYVPVQWLIDQSPLREPLLRWAELYGQRAAFVAASATRSTYWGTTSPWLYALGWTILGVACVVGPALPIRLILIRLLRASLPVAARGQ